MRKISYISNTKHSKMTSLAKVPLFMHRITCLKNTWADPGIFNRGGANIFLERKTALPGCPHTFRCLIPEKK